jgi:FMN phosphatase YigB (HAD superfamily)
MRKILFLDFDGVLHPLHFKEGSEFSRVRLLEDVACPILEISYLSEASQTN